VGWAVAGRVMRGGQVAEGAMAERAVESAAVVGSTGRRVVVAAILATVMGCVEVWAVRGAVGWAGAV
jgi:hypothetical protein